jgi:hypothetical protein
VGVNLFATFGRRGSDGNVSLSLDPGTPVPIGFAAIAEALAYGGDLDDPCRVTGQRLADAGVSLEEALDGLAVTHARMGLGPPGFVALRALAAGWADAVMRFVHRLSCADPLTGLTTLAHAHTRLRDLYRRAEGLGRPVVGSHALLVVELLEHTRMDTLADPIEQALRLVGVEDAVRAVYPQGETMARVGTRRAVAVVRRTPLLGEQLNLVRQMLAEWGEGPGRHRVWVEGLPDSGVSAAVLLDELAR